MKKEDFLYQFLLKYNEYENKFNGQDAVSYWRDNDSSGLIFMVLRNALVHNSKETISRLETISSLNNILNSLKICNLESGDKIKYMSIFLDNDWVKSDLQNKKFKQINSSGGFQLQTVSETMVDPYAKVSVSRTKG